MNENRCGRDWWGGSFGRSVAYTFDYEWTVAQGIDVGSWSPDSPHMLGKQWTDAGWEIVSITVQLVERDVRYALVLRRVKSFTAVPA